MKILKNYLKIISDTSFKLDLNKLSKIENIIFRKIENNNKIFVCGNGGAGSVANHFLCDFNKGVKISSKNKLKPKVISLSNNVETILAVSNDISFDKIFSFQLENYFSKGDILITFSCSGSSPNIVDILNFSKKKKIFSISFTGFAKKKFQNKSNINLDIGIKNYGITEDFFQIIMHMLSQNIRIKFVKNTKKIIL